MVRPGNGTAQVTVGGRAWIALAAAVALGACGDGERTPADRPSPAADLTRALLVASDLGRGFRVVERGPQLRSEQPGGDRSDPRRFGRQTGWKARFARSGTPRTRGPLVVESRADAFADPAGAGRELQSVRDEISRTGSGVRPLPPPAIGDEAVAFATTQRGLAPVRFVTIVWRSGRLTASVSANGFRGVSLGAVLALARRQQERLPG